MSSTTQSNLSEATFEEIEYNHEEGFQCQYTKTVEDTEYLSDSSSPGDAGSTRGRKRKHVSPDEVEIKRVTANHQERQRMMKLNTALDNLRQCLPEQFKIGNRKMSKIRTLRLASSYIKNLSDMLKHNTDIRDSIPPQPDYDHRLPCLLEVNRQGDSGEIYTPEKDLAFNQFPVALSTALPNHRHWCQHQRAPQDSSPTFADMSPYHSSVLQYYQHQIFHYPLDAYAVMNKLH